MRNNQSINISKAVFIRQPFSYFASMFKRSAFIFCLFFLSLISATAQDDSSHLRVSLITCGVGEELYASFGHTAVRVVDTVKGIDIVYNYGTFSFDEDFYPKFVRGKLLYYVSYYDFNSFVQEYVEEDRKSVV